jgi:HAD superfamily hydrolase (TIGR01509 family)
MWNGDHRLASDDMKAIVFDWDGTLVDTLSALYAANQRVFAAFELPFDELLYRRHFAPDWRLMYRRLGIPENRLEEANQQWMAAYDQGISSRLFDGVREALDALAAAGHQLGLVTAGHRDVVLPQMERLGLVNHFEAAVFGDDLAVHKPHPAPLRRALERLGLDDRPADAAYLGDVPDDMRMACAVGSHAVGIVSVLGEATELRAAGAEEVAPSVARWAERFLGSALSGRPTDDPAAAPGGHLTGAQTA